jgi:hypothetical protein
MKRILIVENNEDLMRLAKAAMQVFEEVAVDYAISYTDAISHLQYGIFDGVATTVPFPNVDAPWFDKIAIVNLIESELDWRQAIELLVDML